MYSVSFEERAELELYEAIDYYNELNIIGLTEKFHKDLSNIIRIIEVNPFFEIKVKKYRAIPFENFPFLAFFSLNELKKEVKIVSIFHTSQNPQYYP